MKFSFPVYYVLGLILVSAHTSASTLNINLSGTLVDNPPSCVLNGNAQQLVGFDDVLLPKIDGSEYLRPLALDLVCTNLSSRILSLEIKGDSASFSNDGALQTTNRQLGIQFYLNGVIRPINSKFYVDSLSLPTLRAAPVKNATATSSNTTGGRFTSLATLEISYP